VEGVLEEVGLLEGLTPIPMVVPQGLYPLRDGPLLGNKLLKGHGPPRLKCALRGNLLD